MLSIDHRDAPSVGVRWPIDEAGRVGMTKLCSILNGRLKVKS